MRFSTGLKTLSEHVNDSSIIIIPDFLGFINEIASSFFLSNFFIAINAVAPMIVLLIIGAVIRRKNWLNGQELKHLNGVLLKVFFFFMLFNATYHMRPGSFRWHMVGYIIASVFLIICMGWIFAKKFLDNPKSQGAFVQALFRSNYGLMGVAIVMNLYPPSESGVAVILTALIVPMNNAIAVAVLEHFRGGSMTFKRLFKALFMNSMTLGVFCACVLLAMGIPLPAFLDNTSKQLAMMTPHLAIIILGASTMEVGIPNMKYLIYYNIKIKMQKKYDVLGVVGEGAYGIVYKCKNKAR